MKSPGEEIRDKIIAAGIKSSENAGYAAGNSMDQFVEVSSEIGKRVDLVTQLTGGTEASGALGRIAFKAGRDIVRGDSACTGLCLVFGACETIALGCSTIKIIPYRGKIYVCTKVINKG
jgi:hypothetical protein